MKSGQKLFGICRIMHILYYEKKITGVILIAVMAVSGLVACGVKEEDVSALQQNSSVVSTVNLESIQAAVEAEDMEALADMSYYPLYVSFGEGEGEELESREDFMALDSSRIFTEELKDAVAATDISSLEVFRAGVIVGADDAIVFNEMDGKLMITSMYF